MEKTLKPIRVTDKTAIKLIHENAPTQNRSLANCAASAIIAALSAVQNSTNNPSEKQAESEQKK